MKSLSKFVVAIVALALPLLLPAQVYMGIRGGVNIATVSDLKITMDGGERPALDQSSITGIDVAVLAEFSLSPSFALQPELHYLQKGAALESTTLGEDNFSVDMKVNYLELPVLAKFLIGEQHLKADIFAGPSLGYALDGKYTFNIGGIESSEDIKFDNDYDANGEKDNRIDFSAVFGAGLQLGLGKGSLLLDGRYSLDFTDFTKFENGEPAGYDPTYNRGVAFTLGYMLPLGMRADNHK
jgi:hypothetical protein